MTVDVEVLTRDHPKSVWTVEGIVIHTVPSLIAQLRDAVYGGLERGAGSPAMRSRLPIDAAALDLYMLVDRQVTDVWVEAFKRVPGADRIEVLLSEWAAFVSEDTIVTVDDRGVYAKDAVSRWAGRIEDFFDPPRNSQIQAACIQCGVSHLAPRGEDDAPEFALRFVRDRSTGETLRAECASCGATWPPSNFEYLGRQIGIDVERKKDEFFEHEAARAKKTHMVPEVEG